MAEAAYAVFEDIILYNNQSFLLLLFMAALIYLWITEKNTKIKTVFVYITAAITVIFICPLYAWVGMKIDADIYYRVWWSLPVSIMVCYSAVKIMRRFRSLVGRAVVLLAAIFAIMLNGDLVYAKTLHFKSVNPYHIPQQVIDVADALKLDNYKPVAVLPAELLAFFRQYSADIYTPYGRNMLEPQWNFSNELYDAMEGSKESYDAEEVARCARDEHCVYVVLSCAKRIEGSMEDQNYFLLNFVQGYYIYMDYNYYWVLKEQNLLDADVIAVGEYRE